jgi:hypothetical protein
LVAARTLNIIAVLLVGFWLAVPYVALGQSSSVGDTVDADALNQQIIQLYNQGRYSEAIPLAQRGSHTRKDSSS